MRRGFESRNRGNSRDYLILDDGKKVKERKKERNERFFSFYFRFFLSFRGKNVSSSVSGNFKFLEEERKWKDRKYHRAGDILRENKKGGEQVICNGV